MVRGGFLVSLPQNVSDSFEKKEKEIVGRFIFKK